MKQHQDTEVSAQPQGDGDSRPFDVARIIAAVVENLPEPITEASLKEYAETGMTPQMKRQGLTPFDLHGHTGQVRVHLEKSGPAFKRGAAFLPVPIAEQLEASLVAQTGTTIGEVLNAIQRKCLLDLMPTWTRLLRVYGQPPSGQSRTALRRDWFWGEALDAIAVALCYSEREGCAVKWIVADMVIRGEAAEAAIHAERTLCDYVNSPDGQETAEMLQRHIATYRAFAEGKS